MPAGVMIKNAPEVLGSDRMLRFIEESKNAFDIILFDSPPVLPVADAMILASMVDGIVLVSRAKKTSRKQLQKTIDLLKSVNGPIIGGILNGIQSREQSGYREYYKTYHKNVASRLKILRPSTQLVKRSDQTYISHV
jgi:Mrp family chromosome partitioning ATPase